MPFAKINGIMLHYRTSGEGIPVVFIHPPLLTGANFNYQHAELSYDFQVVTFDIRGHGRSAESDIPVTYELIAEDLIQLLDHLQIDKAFVCGYSTGGSIALEALLAYPDRLYGGILISAMSEASDIVLRTRIRLAMGFSRSKSLSLMLMLGIAWGNADSLRTFRNLLRGAASGNIRNIHQYYSYSLGYSCTNQLSRIKAPILLLYGEKDKRFKRYRQLLQRTLRNFEVLTLNNKSHQLPTKAAYDMNNAIRYWIHDVFEEKGHSSGKEAEIPDAYAAFVVPPEAAGEPDGQQPAGNGPA
ncbi:alpha/beta hydrolase [Paenibacillus sp. sptzw28]|uniref:alpha/beta fold hydrolase n=1 Tax=Paenibacillus sp. sptzw28 TaxID=715179 RepID=UPI001C6E1210|nr:alpha/beta hydrolase [Paenibacillus sp. sptzw28]QYR20905.1 alpha/beta hydrolase [Paenibacillus sp. sptzw28]